MSGAIHRPTCSYRISIGRLGLLLPGLQQLVTEMANVAAKNKVRIVLRPPKCNMGAYSKSHCATVRHIWTIVKRVVEDPPAAGKTRLSLDCFGVAACQLAARLSRRLASTPKERRAIGSLLKLLEAWRKHAVRYYVRKAGRRSYAQASYRWRQFVRWVRAQALAKIPTRFLNPPPADSNRRYTPKLDHLRVQAGMDQARRELTARDEPVPPNPKLRELIRQAFRKVHRSKLGCGTSIRDLVSRPHGAAWLGDYILRKTGIIKS